MLPVIPANKLITNPQGQPSTFPFPPNIAEDIPKHMRERIMLWMLTNYIWPQIQDRQKYEAQWDKLLSMARATWKISDMKLSDKGRAQRLTQQKAMEGNLSPGGRADIADTIIFDAIDRLNNLNHFISFKDEMPVKFQLPKWVRRPKENQWYSPTSDLCDAFNSLVQHDAENTQFYRKHWIQGKHHYTYGISFAISEFQTEIEDVMRRTTETNPTAPPNGAAWAPRKEITKIGTTFEGISIRKLWLNVNIPVYNMEYQPCPFFYEEMPRFAIVANPYNPIERPFGYLNLQSLPQGQWMFSDQTSASAEAALKLFNEKATLSTLGKPELNTELKWTLFPMLPLQKVPVTQEALTTLTPEEQRIAIEQQAVWDFDDDGRKGIPLRRYIMEAFGVSLTSGQVEIIRLQENFYPRNSLPLYGSVHMPDLDSGVYSPAIGDILESHYTQLAKAINQFLDNKDLLNDPPVKMQINSPSRNTDLHKPGAKNPVNSMNDYEEAPMVDSTGTTGAFIQDTRDQARTSSKAVDAIVGKAMGSRTSATEASNIFTTAMSGVTTDINLFNYDIAGGFAQRVVEYAGLWVDPDVLEMITGQYGLALKPEHFSIRLDMHWAVGSTFIDSITRQQNYRYMLETAKGDPNINSAYLWKELLKEWKIGNIDQIVNDGNMMQQIQEANNQAAATYLGDLVMVDPEQNHAVAIEVKKSYLKDRDSVWNTTPEYVRNGQRLVEQITLHGKYLMLQMMQQQAQAAAGLQPLQSPNSPSLPPSGAPPVATQAGQAAQLAGGII